MPAPIREAGTGRRRRMLLLLPGEDGVDRGQEAVRTHGGGSEVSRRLIKKNPMEILASVSTLRSTEYEGVMTLSMKVAV